MRCRENESKQTPLCPQEHPTGRVHRSMSGAALRAISLTAHAAEKTRVSEMRNRNSCGRDSHTVLWQRTEHSNASYVTHFPNPHTSGWWTLEPRVLHSFAFQPMWVCTARAAEISVTQNCQMLVNGHLHSSLLSDEVKMSVSGRVFEFYLFSHVCSLSDASAVCHKHKPNTLWKVVQKPTQHRSTTIFHNNLEL